MRTTHRNYSEEAGDFNRLFHFFIAVGGVPRSQSTWCLGRIVDWKWSLFENKRTYTSFCEQNAHLWFDAFGELAGFAVSEGGDAGFHVLTLDGYRFLYEDMLQWVLEHWKDRIPGKGPCFSTEVTEQQGWEIHVLERYGFRCTDTFFTRRFDLTRELAPRAPLEPGFVIVDMKSHPDYRAQAMLRANAFQEKNDLSPEDLHIRLKYYNHSIQGPIYHPDIDLCVMAEDGRLVSGAEALINAHCLEADIERVCTHSDFRQRGFARAVSLDCMYRLKEIGMRNAYITGYSPAAIALYGSMGHADEFRSFIYETMG
ncbi:MAG: GNAT family N-acetyltransferase [Bacteroidota bacterium]